MFGYWFLEPGYYQGFVALEAYLGIDVGSVTTKLAVLDGSDELIASLYLPTGGRPLEAVQKGLRTLGGELPDSVEVRGAAATGSARHLAGAVAGADLVKNEITCQAAAAVHYVPDVTHRHRDRRAGQQTDYYPRRHGGGLPHEYHLRRRYGQLSRPPGGPSRHGHRGAFAAGAGRRR